MPLLNWLLAAICVLAVAGGQLLFKRVGLELETSGTWRDPRVLGFAAAGFVLYGASTLLWIHVLRAVDLGRVYPLMALSFVFVPLGSAWLFGEKLSLDYFLGVGLVVVGVAWIARAG